MPNTVTYELSAEEGKVIDAMRRVTGAMKDVESAGERVNRKHKEQGGILGDLSGKVKEFGAAITGLAAGYATFEGLKNIAEQYFASLEAGAEKQKTIGAGLRQLAQDTQGGPAAIQARLAESAGRGKGLGVSPDQMAQIDDWAGDVAGRFGEAVVKDLASREVTLEKIGFDPEATRDAMASLVKQGMKPEEASRMIAGAFMNTDLKPATMAKLPTALEKFASPQEGLAVAAGMADMGIYTSKELPGKVEDVGSAFAKGGKIEKFLRKKYADQGLNYDDMTMENKLADLEGLGYGDAKKLKSKFKLSDSQAETVSEVMKRKATIDYARGQIAQTQPGFAESQLKAMKETPALESYYGGEKAKAAADYAATFGGQADANRLFEKRRAELGQGMLENHPFLSQFTVGQDGLAGTTTTIAHDIYNAMGKGAAMGGPGGNPGYAMQMQEHTQALKENTEATRANTAATSTTGDQPAAPTIAQRRNR